MLPCKRRRSALPVDCDRGRPESDGMSHSVRKHLRVEVDAYDAAIRSFIPGYEAMLDAAASAVASISSPERSKPIRFLSSAAPSTFLLLTATIMSPTCKPAFSAADSA